jgi:hypothetical protein
LDIADTIFDTFSELLEPEPVLGFAPEAGD